MIPTKTSRVDMHCHSTASARAKLGIQRALGLPECATPPEEVYELAKRRGMDFVTVTDHDTIDGVLEIADRPDVFVSEELTVWFAGSEQAVHVLCYGITPEDHERLQERARDLEECARYLGERELTCALAHPFFSVAAPLGPSHRRRLAELFGIWETRNGSRARELNLPAAVYIETHGGTGIGGSDDHAGVDIGRTFTEVPAAATPEEFLLHVREGRADPRGAQGSAAKWAHSALALGARVIAAPELDLPVAVGRASPARVLEMAERVVREGGERGGEVAEGLGPDDARMLLAAWVGAVELPAGEGDAGDPAALVRMMQADEFSHAELYRRARGTHERLLREAVELVLRAAERGEGYGAAAAALFDACIPIVPYVPSVTFLAGEKSKLALREGEPHRVALIADAAGSMHGVTHTIERIREHGVPGYEVEVIGTDPRVDRRLPAVAEVEVPFYPGLTVGVPSVPELVETLAERHYDLIHVTAPGPAGVAATVAARIGGTPLVASHHTELVTYAALRSGDQALTDGMARLIALLYTQAQVILSPSAPADESVIGLGISPERLGRWARGVDLNLYDPAKRDPSAYPGDVKVLYAGRLSKEKGAGLLADSFLIARERDPRLHLLLAGGGPEEPALRERLGEHATFLGWLGREELARAYASSDVFLFCSETDTYGQVIAEAQASGLPVVAVAAGGPATLIRDRHTGWLCPPQAEMLAAAVAQLAESEFLRARLSTAARKAVRERSWERSLEQLAGGYDRALGLRARRVAASYSRRVA